VCTLLALSLGWQRWEFLGGLSEGSSATCRRPILQKPRSRFWAQCMQVELWEKKISSPICSRLPGYSRAQETHGINQR
jgi:hypothetical protein